MKSFTLTFSDLSGQFPSEVLEIHATSFADAYVKAKSYEQYFINLVLTDIHFNF